MSELVSQQFIVNDALIFGCQRVSRGKQKALLAMQTGLEYFYKTYLPLGAGAGVAGGGVAVPGVVPCVPNPGVAAGLLVGLEFF